MKVYLLIGFILFNLLACQTVTESEEFVEEDLTQYVSTLIGTKPWSGKIQLAGLELAEGHTFPGVCPPFAMTEWSPQTTTGTIPYWYEEEGKIQGFRATHYPSGAVMAEYGSFTLFPGTGKPVLDPEARASSFDHATEIAKPHYYHAFLDDSQVKAEVTATSRASFLQFTFPKNDSAYISLDFFGNQGVVTIDKSKNEITGYSTAPGLGSPSNFACYFVVEMDKTFEGFELATDSTTGVVSFSTVKDEVVKLRIGTSFIDVDQARKNLAAEIPEWDFEAVCEQTKALWNKELNKIQVEDDNLANKTIFYTALYHSLLLPREFSEQGRYYSPYDGKVHEGVSYTDYSLWDTYRSEHPLLIFLTPDKVESMIESLLNNYDEGGWIPKWPNPGYSSVMMGTHADALIADAYVKGIRNFDADKAWEAMLKNANERGTDYYAGRIGIEDYIHYGFVPGDKHGESVARTLEFAYDDYCLAQMAKAMGKDEEYKKYITRAHYYKNVLDKGTNNVRGKFSNGAWMDANDNAISIWSGTTKQSLEIYKWNHTFLAPHDVSGLIAFFGGKDNFMTSLDTLFDQEYYYVGDEFSMHAPYLYNYGGKPWKTQRLVRELMADYFTEAPDGLCGNEDCGQLSSWYIFGAMGFYPVAPGDDYYTIGSPIFDKVGMNLANGKRFTISSENRSTENVYIQSATLNGEVFTKSYIKHDQIMAGGTLHFVMGNQPNKAWGSGKDDLPISSIGSSNYVAAPAINYISNSFEDSLIVQLESIVEDGRTYYTLDGTEPTDKSKLYEAPIVLKETTTIKVITYKEGAAPSITIEADIYRRPKGRSITLLTDYNEKYAGDGPQTLIDYSWGSHFFLSTSWLGYYGNDMEAVIDLGGETQVKTISASFIQDMSNWIFFPKAIEFYGSNDGRSFNRIETVTFDNEQEMPNVSVFKSFKINLNESYKYIKVVAKNQAECPSWHPFKGGKCWLFIDEILVNE